MEVIENTISIAACRLIYRPLMNSQSKYISIIQQQIQFILPNLTLFFTIFKIN